MRLSFLVKWEQSALAVWEIINYSALFLIYAICFYANLGIILLFL